MSKICAEEDTKRPRERQPPDQNPTACDFDHSVEECLYRYISRYTSTVVLYQRTSEVRNPAIPVDQGQANARGCYPVRANAVAFP